MNSDGSGRRLMFEDIGGNKLHSPGLAWSPDGKTIAFNGLFVWDQGAAEARLLDEHGDWPAWSPDGSKIAFWDPSPREKDTGFRLTVIDRVGSTTERVEGSPVLGYTYGGLDWAC
jgi:Tol biopolymer transport system component